MPISSSIAESAVNEVVSLRCAKKRQMRWTDKGAHLLVQVRVAVLNGELKMRGLNRDDLLQTKKGTFVANALPSAASGFDCSPLRIGRALSRRPPPCFVSVATTAWGWRI